MHAKEQPWRTSPAIGAAAVKQEKAAKSGIEERGCVRQEPHHGS